VTRIKVVRPGNNITLTGSPVKRRLVMDARKERRVLLAQRGDIVKHANGWKVRSASGNGSYFVHLDDKPTCTCPDFESRSSKCKHIYAVECILVWNTVTEGGTTVVTKTKTVRVTYKQNWPVYNAAQTEEKARFIPLLEALCAVIDQPAQGRGRPRLPLADMVFSCVYKVYEGFSSRRFSSDLREAQAQEHIATA